jgi:hypothetical protein
VVHVPAGLPRSRARIYHPAAVAVALAAMTACARPPAIEVPKPGTAVDTTLVSAAIARTAPSAPTRIVFSWTMQAGDARFSGKGVARVEAPYRARLDLFGPRGETYLTAVLIGGELKLPAAAADAPIPSAALLWSSLGVFRAPDRVPLVGATSDSSGTRLTYAAGEDRWLFDVGATRLTRVEHDRPDKGRETVELRGTSALGLAQQATYRDWTAFRELVLSIEEARHVESFSPDIWQLDTP